MGRNENKEQNNVLIPQKKLIQVTGKFLLLVHITSKLSKNAQSSLGFCLEIKLLKRIKQF